MRGIIDDCFEQAGAADLIIACLDGADADSGTCVEVGYALGLKKPVIGFRTDFRASEDNGVNAMLSFGCTKYIPAPCLEYSPTHLILELVSSINDLLPRPSAR